MNKLIETIEAKSEPDFQTIVSGYNKITPFDKVKTTLLVRVKEVHLPQAMVQ